MTLDSVLTTTRDVAAPTPETLARGRDAVLDAVRADLTTRARIVRHRTYRRRATGLAAIVTAAAVGVLVAVSGSNRTPGQLASPVPPVTEVRYANAAQIVDAAALAAGQGSDQLGDAPYWKVDSEYEQSGSENPQDDHTGRRTIWQGMSGPSVLQDTFGGDITVEDAEVLALPQSAVRVSGRTYTWPEFNASEPSADVIHALLYAGEEEASAKPGRPPQAWYVFKQAGELLGETPASPAVRQAIWREVSALDGVTTAGKTTDATGREGWNLTMSLASVGTQRFIIDPSTGAILQTEQEGQGVTYRQTYLAAGPAETAPTADSDDTMPVP